MRLRIDRLWDGRPARADEAIALEIHLGESLEIEVDAPWHGDPAPEGPPGPRAALWEHEVVEIFLVGPEGPARAYTEIELGPHGHHLVLRLEGVRNPVQTELPIAWTVAQVADRWRGRAVVDRALLPDPIVAFNAFAIHGSAERRYLALHPVPGPAPDFHRLQHFAPWRG